MCGGESAEETEAYAYDSTADLMENLLKDHNRHYVPGEGGYDGLTGNERGTSERGQLSVESHLERVSKLTWVGYDEVSCLLSFRHHLPR